jgi:hypothetical protein
LGPWKQRFEPGRLFMEHNVSQNSTMRAEQRCVFTFTI